MAELTSEGLTEELAIALFEKEIEKGQQRAEEDGLGKIGMMPHKTKWEELAKKDKGYWIERAEELRTILRTLGYSPPQEVKRLREESEARHELVRRLTDRCEELQLEVKEQVKQARREGFAEGVASERKIHKGGA